MEKEILLNNGVKIPTPGFGTFLLLMEQPALKL